MFRAFIWKFLISEMNSRLWRHSITINRGLASSKIHFAATRGGNILYQCVYMDLKNSSHELHPEFIFQYLAFTRTQKEIWITWFLVPESYWCSCLWGLWTVTESCENSPGSKTWFLNWYAMFTCTNTKTQTTTWTLELI